ncbi:unnamed protein product [Closterium sp. Naga37s-1]|nr:unnamed protein product [Closterium sp. Naga37s-1]
MRPKHASITCAIPTPPPALYATVAAFDPANALLVTTAGGTTTRLKALCQLACAHFAGCGACEWHNNYLYGPLPDCLFDKCINEIDVSGNSLYGRINRNFENIVANGNALINLARNFFFGDGALFAAGCKVCPTEVNEPNNNGMWDTTAWRIYGGKCGNVAQGFSVVEPGKRARVALSGNCLTLTPNKKCVSNATQRSTAACQAFCSITANGPCDGHGACVPLAPASPTNFTCLCDAGYTTVDSGNGSSTCAIVHSTTNTTTGNPCFILTAPQHCLIAMFCNNNHFPHSSCLAHCVRTEKWEGLDVCEQFSLQQMLSATNNWSEDNVRAMASLHHTHLVRLLGFCLDQNVETGKQEQILVYEFMANRDLPHPCHR